MLNFPEGFGTALSKVIANKDIAVGLRQISFPIVNNKSLILFVFILVW